MTSGGLGLRSYSRIWRMPANSFLIRAVSSLMISTISDSNVLGKAVSLAESVHPMILETSCDFSSGQLLFSNKWGRNPSGIPRIGTQRFPRIPTSTVHEKEARAAELLNETPGFAC